MYLSCFRRPARPEDRPSATLRQRLSLIGGHLDTSLARLAASTDEASYWLLPGFDGEQVFLYAAYHEGGGSGCGTTVEHLREAGPSASIGVRRGRWRYAVLAADGYEIARVGAARARIVDNLAVLDLPDRERFIEIVGPAGTRVLDLGPRTGTSSWIRRHMGSDDDRRRRALRADVLELILFTPETACLILDSFADDPPGQRPDEHEILEALRALEEEGLARSFVDDVSGWSEGEREGSGIPEAARGEQQILWWEAVSLKGDGTGATTA